MTNSEIPDFESALMDTSRAVIDCVVETIGKEPEKFQAVFELSFSPKKQLAMRASWAIMISSLKNPDLFVPYINKVIISLPEIKNLAVRRCLLRIFVEYPQLLECESLGLLVDACFNFLLDGESPIAVKAYSMKILYRVASAEPMLAGELISAIEIMIPKFEGSLPRMGKRMLKDLSQLQSK